MSITVARAGELFDYSVAHPEFGARECRQEMEWTYAQFGRAVKCLRSILADDTINLICLPGRPPRWKLVGDLASASPWVAKRLKSLESQLDTVFNVSASLLNGTDGRTADGKKARLINRYVGRLREDLDELDGKIPLRRGVSA